MIKQVGSSILFILCLLTSGTHVGIAAAQSGQAYELVDAVNQFRAQHGLPALQVDGSLMAAAQGHAAWMAANHLYSHTGAGGSTPQSRANAAGYAGTVYENIEGGTDLTAQRAVMWWQQDSIHLTTMLLPHHVHIGVGFAANGDQKLFVLMVGQPSPADSTARNAIPAGQASPTGQAVSMIPIVVTTPRADGAVVHVVQQGQTAWAIAARYGIPLADLLKLNNLKSGAVLHAGDSLIIRLGSGQTIPATPTLPTTHVVQQGETLWTIAARSGIPMDDLLTLNHLTRSAILRPGDTLILRQPAPTATPSPLPTETPTETPTEMPTEMPKTAPPSTEAPVASSTSTASASPRPASPTAPPPSLTPTPAADPQAPPPVVPLMGALVVGIGLLGSAAAGVILIRFRRR